ncbi:hypothetical protein GALMADRAFT_264329 [Galerina marginata CBS 339.88]|uniref:F-box domain-containing protein n=1 Tax=Galerina marginata (strain CBS 339.88) TaxID=685588 RepID=A0A067TQ71_GALM3|nr:hypothetical protein GALMADRAFT_264329 [Galerina marginata CBS 339.88]
MLLQRKKTTVKIGFFNLEPQVVLSHVCRRWRSISLSYPSLWTSFSHHGCQSSLRSLARLDAYLERSTSRALELWFDFVGDHSENHFILLEKVLPHIKRWKRVTILSGKDNPTFSFLHSICAVAAPNLEHFVLRFHILDSRRDSDLSVDCLEPTIFTNGAPKLQSLTLDCSSLVSLPPLSAITTLRLEAVNLKPVYPFSWLTFLAILSLPSLASLSLVGQVFEHPQTSTAPLITMNNLIHLRTYGHGVLLPLLPHLRAPSLETLNIHCDWFSVNFGTVGEPQAFPSLQSLYLSEVFAGLPQSAWYFVQLTNYATQILISQQGPFESFFAVLQHYQHFPPTAYWTNLKLLIFNMAPTELALIPVLAKFAEGRPKNPLILRIFDGMDRFWRQAEPTQYEALRGLCTIEIMDSADNPLAQGIDWPPGEEVDSNYIYETDDPFDIEPYSPISE